MTRYSKEFKDNIVKQMMPPTNKSVNQLAAETGVSEHTLYAWKRAAKSAGIAAPAGESSSERWSSEDKFLIVLETASMNQAELAAYCREKGLYVEQVEAWKDFPIIYLLIVYVIWNIGKGYLPIFKYFSLPQFYKWIFGIFMIEMAIIGLVQIFILLGTPANCKKIEKDLMEIGFVDYKGKVPTLLSKMKDKNGIILEFYSSRIPFYEYEKYRAEIETAINIKIVSIDPGRDAQHVFIKAIASDITIPQKIMWDDSYIDMHDFILKLGESYIGEESFDLSIVPHVLIGGGSGSGKSVLIKLILMQCLKKDAVVYLADFKGGVDYPKIWHEKCSIIIEAHELKKCLRIF